MKMHSLVLTSFLLSAPDNVKGDREHLKMIPLPPNPAQVPNPIQPHHAEDPVPAQPVHHRQSEFLLNTSKRGKTVVCKAGCGWLVVFVNVCIAFEEVGKNIIAYEKVQSQHILVSSAFGLSCCLSVIRVNAETEMQFWCNWLHPHSYVTRVHECR